MEKILIELYDKLNHDYDMDGFGHGYEAGIKAAIEIIENNKH
jgi:hypothetical protein